MGGAGFPLATQKAGGGGAVETDEPAPLGGVHRLQGSSYRLLEHFGMFEGYGDEHAGGTGGFALVLFPTAQRAESDSEKISKGLLYKRGQRDGAYFSRMS